jgi:methylenetetrahydrofolate reductase (NADPH)
MYTNQAERAIERLVSSYSIEITAKDMSSLEKSRNILRTGMQISVPFLPGEDLAARIDAAALVRRLGFRPMPHISARRLRSEDELEQFLAALREHAAIDRVFVVAGDPPRPLGPYEDALSVIRTGLLARYGVKTVGIAGYPEGHPDIPEPVLWQALLDKKAVLGDLGHDFEIVTQFAFDASPVLSWLRRVREHGIDVPVRIGIPGPASVKTLLRFAVRCGVGASAKVMAKYGVSITKLLNTAGPDELIREFAAMLDPSVHGEVLLHFYPFGGLAKTAEWVNDFALLQHA